MDITKIELNRLGNTQEVNVSFGNMTVTITEEHPEWENILKDIDHIQNTVESLLDTSYSSFYRREQRGEEIDKDVLNFLKDLTYKVVDSDEVKEIDGRELFGEYYQPPLFNWDAFCAGDFDNCCEYEEEKDLGYDCDCDYCTVNNNENEEEVEMPYEDDEYDYEQVTYQEDEDFVAFRREKEIERLEREDRLYRNY